ncbi:MAG TPA: type II toxin-antitoxin system VapC family toxin [Sulfurovum sp.]|nr:type II toxin-antitoxin system VapC family toxin [Sulfurovum sp.]
MDLKYLLDTNIIIYYLNNDSTAVDFVDKNLQDIAISSITYLEVLVFSYNAKEDRKIRDFLELFTIYDIDMNIIDLAIKIYRDKKVKMADNLIGSTVNYYDLTLVTRNVKDFKSMNMDILNIYE